MQISQKKSESKQQKQIKQWKPYQTIKYAKNIVKSFPYMNQQQIDMNLIELNLISYYNGEALQIIYQRIKDTAFYLKNRHLLENLINQNRQKQLNDKIKQISTNFDQIYVKGQQINMNGNLINAKENDIITKHIQDQFQDSTISSEQDKLKCQKSLMKQIRTKQHRAMFISRRQDFMLALSQISDKIFQCNQGKNQQQVHSRKLAIFTQEIMQINRKIQQEQQIKSTTSTDSADSPQKNKINFSNTRGYIFYFKGEFQQVKEIFLQRSTFLKTKNRSPLVLDFGFQRFLYKNDDQLSHELIAMQLIKYLNKIFQKQYIQQYTIIPQIKGALYEIVENSLTLAQIKKDYKTIPDYLNNLVQKGADRKAFQKKFAQTYAGYCIAEFLLEIKDRNNANIMLKDDGTFFHIDLAFIFAAKPGGISFQSAPFKMTKQYLKVMGGFGSDTFKHFQTILIQLITKIYQSRQQLLWKIYILSARFTQIRCFNGFVYEDYVSMKFVKNLTKVKGFVQNLIDKSYDNWATKKYDSYQNKVNKIPL